MIDVEGVVGGALTKEKLLPDGTRVTYEYLAGTNRLSTATRNVPAGVLGAVPIGGNVAQTTTDRVSYDPAGRPTQSADASGPAVNYEYDASGNRTAVNPASNQSSAGRTEYTYDGGRRLTQVKAPNGTITTFTYNAVGNRTNATYADGTATVLGYDNLNRLTSMVTSKGAQELLSTGYTYNSADQRTKIEQRFSTDTGTITRIADLTYDPQGRLITESTTESNPGLLTNAFTRAITYQYDVTGNRLRKIQTLTAGNGPPASTTTTYQVDANDRLTEEKVYAGAQTGTVIGTPTSTTTYGWDNNGNQTSQRTITGTTTTLKKFRWTPEHRLARIEQATGQNVPANSEPPPERIVDYTYDDGGLRQSRMAYPATLANEVRNNTLTEAQWAQVQYSRHVWDKTADYAQLVAEYDRNNIARAAYVNANPGQGNEAGTHSDHRSGMPSGSGANGIRIGELRAPIDPNSPTTPPDFTNATSTSQTTYHGDAQGSTIAGTSNTGSLIHRLAYDAFGAHLSPDQSSLATANSLNNPSQLGGNGTRLSTWGEASGLEGQPDQALTYLRARTYDSRLGLFLSRDAHSGHHKRPATLHDYLFVSGNPSADIDPSGEDGTLNGQMSAVNTNSNLAGRAIPSLTTSQGQMANRLGNAFAKKIEEAIQGCLKPGAKIRKSTKTDRIADSAGNWRMPDFILTVGEKLAYLEAKTKIPGLKSIGDQFKRVAGQLDAATKQNAPTGLVYQSNHRPATVQSRMDAITKGLSSEQAGLVTVMHGMIGLLEFVREYVVEECFKSAVGL